MRMFYPMSSLYMHHISVYKLVLVMNIGNMLRKRDYPIIQRNLNSSITSIWCLHFTTHTDSRAYVQYSDFLDRLQLLQQGFAAPRLKSSLQKFYDRHHDLVDR